MRFQVDLAIYRGPLDLLLYLVRKHELDVTEIPIAHVTEQFLEYVAVLEQLDVDAVGDFLDMASTLIEIKSRMVLPQSEEVEEELEDARQDLVRRLLEFKRFRDAASMLEEQGRQWQQRYPRLANDLSPQRPDLAEQPIGGVELWDLVSAFGRVMREKLDRAVVPATIIYDETPIHVFMQQIHRRLIVEDRLAFTSLFDDAVHKSTLVGMFLAVLELVRHRHACALQKSPFGEIWLEPGENPLPEDLASVTSYEHQVSQ